MISPSQAKHRAEGLGDKQKWKNVSNDLYSSIFIFLYSSILLYGTGCSIITGAAFVCAL